MMPVSMAMGATSASTWIPITWLGSHAPEAMAAPCTFLALFAAILGAAAATTLRELPCELLPFAALPVSALTYAATALVFAAEIAHHHSRPVLHVALLW